jgi:uncharacterized membrane protein YccF (DUF307 family)
MAAKDLSAMSDTELEGKLKVSTSIQRTTMIVFAVILGAWLALGYWREQLPVFISTVVIAVALTAIQSGSRTAIERELRRRRGQA